MNQNENMKGTTTIGFVCTDGVVLATETRATMGSLIANKAVNKLYQLDDKIGATIAGTVSHAQSLMESLAVLTSNILKSGPYMVQTIIAGVDKTGPKLYSLDPSGSYIEDTCTSTGSGSPFAFGVLEDRYNENLTVDEGRFVAIRAITAAMERDVYSGNGYRLATITEDGMKVYTKEEIEALKEQL